MATRYTRRTRSYQELAPAHHAKRPYLVAKLSLDVVEQFRQVAIALDLRADDLGHLLLIGRPVQHLAVMPIADAQHLLAVIFVASALPPQPAARSASGSPMPQRDPAPRGRCARLFSRRAARAAARNRCRSARACTAPPIGTNATSSDYICTTTRAKRRRGKEMIARICRPAGISLKFHKSCGQRGQRPRAGHDAQLGHVPT